MKEVKQWIKDHKKEIIICVVAAGGTALYFIRKEKKIKGIKAGLRLTFGFSNEEEDGDYYGFQSKNNLYTNLNIYEPGYKVGDLGKVGAELMKGIPSLTKDVPINHLNANFNIIKK
jgi:hypothetical protein